MLKLSHERQVKRFLKMACFLKQTFLNFKAFFHLYTYGTYAIPDNQIITVLVPIFYQPLVYNSVVDCPAWLSYNFSFRILAVLFSIRRE